MKPRFPLPTSANGARLPAFCAALLAALAGLQLWLTADVEIADTVPPSRSVRVALPAFAFSPAPTVLTGQSMFAPARTGAVGVDTGPLDGASVAGMISVRGRAYAVIRTSDGGVVRLPVGGRYQGLRLRRLTPEAAIFDRGGSIITVNYGAASIPSTPAAAENEEPQ